MHIAFLTPEYPHQKTTPAAGLGTSVANLAKGLVKSGCKATIIVYGQNTTATFIEEGVTVFLIKNKDYPFSKWFFYRKHIQNKVNNIVRDNGIDLLEAPDWSGITAFMKFNIPLVIRFHGSDTYFCHLEKRKQKRKNFWFEKIAIEGAKAYIAPTKFAGDLTKQLFSINKKEIRTIHYGLELDKFINPNPELFTKGLILYIGTIIRKKGVFELPEIFKKVRDKYPEAKLLLIGSDSPDIKTQNRSTWEMLKTQFSEADSNNLNYLGKIPYSEVQGYIKKANVCVFPTFAETLGMVAIESMAMQKPVVNSNFSWAQELIEDGKNGYLVNPTHHFEFANRIIDVITNDENYKRLGENASKKVKDKFSVEDIVQQNIMFFKSIL